MAEREIPQPTISEYIEQLKKDKHKLVTYLNRIGYPSSDTQTFTYLCDKLQDIPTPSNNE